MKTETKFGIILMFFSLSALAELHAIKWGVRAGLNMTNDISLAESEKVKYKSLHPSGFIVGPVVEFENNNFPLSFETGLLYNQSYFDMEVMPDIHTTTKYSLLQLPANLKLRFGVSNSVKIYVLGGLYGAYRYQYFLQYKNGDLASKNQDKLDFGATLGAGVRFWDRFELMGTFQNGMEKHRFTVQKPISGIYMTLFETPTIRNITYAINLTYYF